MWSLCVLIRASEDEFTNKTNRYLQLKVFSWSKIKNVIPDTNVIRSSNFEIKCYSETKTLVNS